MTSTSSVNDRLEQALQQRILILDGAMGTMIQSHKLEEEDFRGERFADWSCQLKGNNDLLAITQPDIIKQIHIDYMEAGADIILTNTFNSTSIALADYEMEHMAREYNEKATQVAVAAVETFRKDNPAREIFIAGVLGPTNRTASISPDVNNAALRNVDFDELVEAYTEAAEGLIDGGADILLIETIFDTLNAKAAGFAVMNVFENRGVRLPVMISGTITDASGRTLSGQTTEAFYNSLRHLAPVVFGLNCALGPDLLRQYVAELSRVCEVYVSAHPNAGLPNELGEYDLGPDMMADDLQEWAESGFLNLVGGCCGTTPDHIRVLAQRVKHIAPRTKPSHEPVMRLSGLEPYNLG